MNDKDKYEYLLKLYKLQTEIINTQRETILKLLE